MTERQTERRAVVRQKAFLKAVAFYNNRSASVECTLRDISDNGARLVLVSDVLVPNLIELEIPSKKLSGPATVQWRNGCEVGISFGHGSRGQEAAPKDIESRVAHLESEVEKLRRALGRVRVDMLRSVENESLAE